MMAQTLAATACLCLFTTVSEANQSGRSYHLALANPASVNCAEKGGKSEIRNGDAGQTGCCRFPDGQVCEEWALLKDNRCMPPK
ncbi:DUF333 domain-containing protein [Methylobacterium crusticola]|uniref:putative hemolysin n=1 Tax=Methylobacterium crusticola TaxID=1697972 RepID=UPI000FFC34FA